MSFYMNFYGLYIKTLNIHSKITHKHNLNTKTKKKIRH